MAYFNHAFQKAFLATGATQTSVAIAKMDGTTISTSTNFGYVTTDGVPTYGLNQLKALAASETANGYIGIFSPSTNLTITPDSCCNAYIAGSAIYANDKIGPLAGGYQETNKSKMINPKYVSKYYSVAPCTPQNNVIHVGSTYWTAGGGALTVDTLVAGTGYDNGTYAVETTNGDGTGSGVILEIVVTGGTVDSATVLNPGKGYAINDTLTLVGGNDDATVDVATITTAHAQTGCGTSYNCCKEFLCGETYNLRIDIKGSPALRFLDHNAYYTADAYTGCCPEGAIAPVAVDSTEVMIKWASGITNSPIVSPFVQVVVQAEDGTLWYAPGTSTTFLAANGADTWDNYVSTGHTDGACAGLILNGAYVDTKFGDCTFQLTDFYEVEPVKLYASEVDLTGDPCTFDALCVVTECQGLQVQGLGETVLRELTMSESYRQNFLATDLRIREITQGNQIVSSVNRSGLYYRYSILHSVPRFNNPSGTFDNDQYLLEIFSQNALATFNTDMTNWLGTSGCSVCSIEAITCSTTCVVPIEFPAVPVYNPYNTVACN
jgi:hypothetical protein